MFYSTDLLNVRGGQFNLIWLMSTTHDSKNLAKKRQKELFAANLGKMCEGVSRMLPVAGKEKSFSLRTSSYLVHGLTVCFKLKVIHLNNDAQKMLMASIKGKKINHSFICAVDNSIPNDESVTNNNHVASCLCILLFRRLFD